MFFLLYCYSVCLFGSYNLLVYGKNFKYVEISETREHIGTLGNRQILKKYSENKINGLLYRELIKYILICISMHCFKYCKKTVD